MAVQPLPKPAETIESAQVIPSTPSFASRGFSVACYLLAAGYTVYAIVMLRSRWFNPGYTTDDARQQLFPFYEAIYPENFAGDLIAKAMKAYLAPLHWWMGFAITKVTGDPILTGHWMMAIQLLPALAFLFLTVRKLSSTPVALFSFVWFLHCQKLVQRVTGGLPRGWWPLVLSAYLYFLAAENHVAILITIGIAILLNPPAAFFIAMSYGIYLVWRTALPSTRASAKPILLRYIALSPIFAAIAFLSVQRSPDIGKMATLRDAEKMSAFSRNNGRFSFLPFYPAVREIPLHTRQAFLNEGHELPERVKRATPWFAASMFVALGILGWKRKRFAVPSALMTYLAAVFVCYFAARALAFQLYVPNRYLGAPLSIFFVVATPVALWSVFADPVRKQMTGQGVAAFLALGLALVALGGPGLRGDLNFNIRVDRDDELMAWIRDKTPATAVIAGNPYKIQGIPLMTARKVFVTEETAHPFYDQYFREMTRRLKLNYKAYYGTRFDSLVNRAKDGGFDYIILKPDDFTPNKLRRAGAFGEHDRRVRALASRDPKEYLINKLPPEVDLVRAPYMPYRDKRSAVIDIRALESVLQSTKLDPEFIPRKVKRSAPSKSPMPQ